MRPKSCQTYQKKEVSAIIDKSVDELTGFGRLQVRKIVYEEPKFMKYSAA